MSLLCSNTDCPAGGGIELLYYLPIIFHMLQLHVVFFMFRFAAFVLQDTGPNVCKTHDKKQ